MSKRIQFDGAGTLGSEFVAFDTPTVADMSFVIDEDTMASNLDTKVPTQQSVKAYVDGRTGRTTNLQTGTTYDFVLGDNNNTTNFSNAGAVVATVLPQATTAWLAETELSGTYLGAATLTLAGSGAATITAPTGRSLVLLPGGSYSLHRTGTNAWSAAGDFVPADATSLNSTTTHPGLLPKLTGSTNNFLRADGTFAAPSVTAANPRVVGLLPTGAISQTIPRTATMTGNTILATGKESMFLVWFDAGETVSTITFLSGSTALSVGTNQWFTLRSSARALLGITNNDTSNAWAGTSLKTLTLATPYVIPTAGYYYLGIMVAATTPPNLVSTTFGGGVNSVVVPMAAGFDNTNTGLTNTASAPATSAALSAHSNMAYAYAS